MTDVLKIAMERREKLRSEVARLDDFIATAEGLLRDSGASPAAAGSSDTASSSKAEDSAESGDVPRPSIIRRGLAS